MPTPTRHQIVISADGHCGAPLWDYKQYLDRRYHEEFDPWARSFRDPWSEELDQERPVNNRSGVASMGAPLNWDSQLRLDYLDAQGISGRGPVPQHRPTLLPLRGAHRAGAPQPRRIRIAVRGTTGPQPVAG